MKKSTEYRWTEECQQAFDELKQWLVTAPTLIFPYWDRIFLVHVDASSITLGIVLVQLSEGKIDHPIAFASRKLADA